MGNFDQSELIIGPGSLRVEKTSERTGEEWRQTGPALTNVVSLGQPGGQGDTDHIMETEESLALPGQVNNNNNHHQQLPDTSSIRNYNSDLQTLSVSHN